MQQVAAAADENHPAEEKKREENPQSDGRAIGTTTQPKLKRRRVLVRSVCMSLVCAARKPKGSRRDHPDAARWADVLVARGTSRG